MSTTSTETVRQAPRQVGVVRAQAWEDARPASAPTAPVAQLSRALNDGAEGGRLPAPPLVSRPRPAVHPALTAEVHDADVHALVDAVVEARMNGGMEDESAFFAGDSSAVYDAVAQWRASPIGSRVEIFYAVKCNPSPMVSHSLSLSGVNFDCASSSEINHVLSLPAQPSPDRIIFANPCKPASFVRKAAQVGVDMMTFDNADESHKVKASHPGAKLVSRISTDDSKSLCRLGLKFGAPSDVCPSLSKTAKESGLDVVGVSFHVGSGCKDPEQFADAIWRARRAFDMAAEAGFDLKSLDIGGGFERETFAQMSRVISDNLDMYFPASEGVRVIAEPGRFLVSSAFTSATNVIARRKNAEAAQAEVEDILQGAEGEGSADVMYYINDGVYGSFNCISFDHQIVHPYPSTVSGAHAAGRPAFPPPPNVELEKDSTLQLGYRQTQRASVWGPTCDSIDCVRAVVSSPPLEVGDWLGWAEMGAYTLCAASTFNGFDRSPVHWTTGGESKNAQVVREVLGKFKQQ